MFEMTELPSRHSPAIKFCFIKTPTFTLATLWSIAWQGVNLFFHNGPQVLDFCLQHVDINHRPHI